MFRDGSASYTYNVFSASLMGGNTMEGKQLIHMRDSVDDGGAPDSALPPCLALQVD